MHAGHYARVVLFITAFKGRKGSPGGSQQQKAKYG